MTFSCTGNVASSRRKAAANLTPRGGTGWKLRLVFAFASVVFGSLFFVSACEAFPAIMSVAPAVKNAFGEHEYRYAGGRYEDELFRYRMFVPRNIEPGKRYPLLVWLHGLGENGSDNEISLRWLESILTDLEHLEKYRFFILVVQCPGGNPSWFNGYAASNATAADDMLTVAFEIMQKTIREQPVDPDRVHLAGVSSGGDGCWEMGMRYPEVFASIVPMASPGGDITRVARLANIPTWVFHNETDRSTSPDGDKQTVAALQAVGGNALLALLPHSSHNCWQEAFRQFEAMNWMLAQRRGQWICWTPPGSKVWQWWHILGVPAVFLLIASTGWVAEQRRRRLLRAAGKNEAAHEEIASSVAGHGTK